MPFPRVRRVRRRTTKPDIRACSSRPDNSGPLSSDNVCGGRVRPDPLLAPSSGSARPVHRGWALPHQPKSATWDGLTPSTSASALSAPIS